ncbi:MULTISPECIES: SRPBCC family protein [Thalassospira]|uniref:Vanillate O-demethylase oxidoreductase VanB n=2 Tax=Thalassospira TaxID=168934 RepID=A0A367WCH9_9PROT|nr:MULTISPECIES: SRPBCC family protein [Thalassospira]MDG4717393.1 SRPBCC family protein [Thalassospira sp. FZY0004]RCK39128.1 vanillate O-demethylase oxidoreductase VanB [Thalassospira profundimaris]
MSNTIEKSIEIKASRSRVWKALTDSKEFGAWFGINIEGPFVVGKVSKGMITIDGFTHVPWNSTIKAMEEPAYFAYTWHPYAVDPDVDYSGEPETLVEFWLEEGGGQTSVRVRETGFDNLPPHRIADALRANTHGWGAQLENIKKHVEN